MKYGGEEVESIRNEEVKEKTASVTGSKFCTECGVPIVKGNKFCGECGHKL